MLGVLGEEGKKKKKEIILCKIPSERFFPFGRLTCNTTRHSLTEGWRAKKKDEKKKKSHEKTQASCTSQQTVFKLVQKTENNSIKISQMTPSSILNGTLLISNKITID